jgi:tetratricopeptide (TPR) repeat protein
MRNILIGLALTLAAVPAWAQTEEASAMRCADHQHPDVSINECTAIINSGQETTTALFAAYYNRGFAYGHKGLYDQAIADETNAIWLKPDYSEAYNNRAAAYAKKGLYTQAIADETIAIWLKPDYFLAYNNRAISYANKGLYIQAIADSTEAIALKPDFAAAYNARAWTYHLMGEDAKGLPDAETAVALAPMMVGTRAAIHEKLGHRETAIADYREALKLEPNDQDARDGLKRLNAGQ